MYIGRLNHDRDTSAIMLWLALAFPLSIVDAAKPPLGVSPQLAARYVPLKINSGLWQCLDGSKEIPWKAINDDYCDCPDGSDEPGLKVQNNTMKRC